MIDLVIDSLRAGETEVIRSLSFSSKSRSLHIEGGVGSGKTLLGRALCGDFVGSTLFKVAGNVRLGDTQFRLPRVTSRESAADRTAYIAQSATSFFVSATVRGEMFVSSTGAAKSAADTDRIYREWLRQTPLASRVETPPLALSGGQQRLLMLEAVVASCPAHIVIDGGMDVFDKAFQQRAAAVVRQWLDDNPQRTLVYFSLPKASEWMEFGDKLVLRSTAPPGESLPSKSTMRASVAKNVVAYRHVAAGPIIDKHPLLKNIELHVKEGEFVALHGANGVGKSTLLRLLAGVVRIRRGRIEFGGRSLSRVRWPGLRGGVGYLPQEPEMAGPYAIRDGGFQGMKRESSTQWNEWNAYLGLKWNGDWGDYWVMSSGQRAQAALLVQLVRQPRFWMFDEPTVRLGAESVLDMFAKLRSAQPLLAAIVVSHNNAFLRAACDRHVELTPNGIAPVYS